jgi:hypothetical protein
MENYASSVVQFVITLLIGKIERSRLVQMIASEWRVTYVASQISIRKNKVCVGASALLQRGCLIDRMQLR